MQQQPFQNHHHQGTAPSYESTLHPQQNSQVMLGNNSSNNYSSFSSFNNFNSEYSGGINSCPTPTLSITQFSSSSDKSLQQHNTAFYPSNVSTPSQYSFHNNNNTNNTFTPRPTTSTTNNQHHHLQYHNNNSIGTQLVDDQDSFFRRHSSTVNNNNFQSFEKNSQQHQQATPLFNNSSFIVQSSLPSVNNLLSTNGGGVNNLIDEDIDELPPTIDMSRIRSNSSHNQQHVNISNRSVMNNEGFMSQTNFSNYSKSKSLSVPTPPSASYLSNPMKSQVSPSYASNNQTMINMQYDIKKTPSPSNSTNSQTFVNSDINQLPSIHSLTNDMMDTTSNNSSSYVHKRGHSDPTNLSKTVPYNFAHRGNLHLTQQQNSPSSPSTQMSCNTPNLMSITTPVSTPSSYVSTARSVVSPNTPTNMSLGNLGNDRTFSPSSSNPPTIQITSQKSKTKSASVKSPCYDQLWFNTKYRFMGRNKYTEFKSVQGDTASNSESKITKSSKMKKNLNVNSPIQ